MAILNSTFIAAPARIRIASVLMAVGLLVSLGACGDLREEATGDAEVQGTMPTHDYRYGGAEVLRVALEHPRRQPDAAGRMREWRQAYQVRLILTLPPVWGPTTRVYLGDELLPEYGGWASGIYFWVYDPARLQSLDGRAIRVQTDDRPMREVGRLEFKDTSELPPIPERQLPAD